MTYLDTSALIKRYIWESGSELVHQMVKESTMVMTSKIAYAEAYAGFTRRMRVRRSRSNPIRSGLPTV